MANTNFDHPIYKAIAHDEDTTGELDTYTNLYRPFPLRNASALYAEGCDPITAQYLATGELPG